MEALVDSARRKESVLVARVGPVDARPTEEFKDPPEAGAVLRCCRGVLEVVDHYVAAVKPQAAYFERLGGFPFAALLRMEDLRVVNED